MKKNLQETIEAIALAIAIIMFAAWIVDAVIVAAGKPGNPFAVVAKQIRKANQ